jgi:hypothetical protein
MGLEAATRIDQLNAAWPLGGTDIKSEGDNHLRVIKAAIQGTFPAIAGVVTPTHTELNLLAGKTGTVWTSTNDGAGSGLDADLLDGQSSAFYQSAANLNAGSIPDARVPSSAVTQHVASINHDALLNYAADRHRLISVQSGGSPSGGTDGDIILIY